MIQGDFNFEDLNFIEGVVESEDCPLFDAFKIDALDFLFEQRQVERDLKDSPEHHSIHLGGQKPPAISETEGKLKLVENSLKEKNSSTIDGTNPQSSSTFSWNDLNCVPEVCDRTSSDNLDKVVSERSVANNQKKKYKPYYNFVGGGRVMQEESLTIQRQKLLDLKVLSAYDWCDKYMANIDEYEVARGAACLKFDPCELAEPYPATNHKHQTGRIELPSKCNDVQFTDEDLLLGPSKTALKTQSLTCQGVQDLEDFIAKISTSEKRTQEIIQTLFNLYAEIEVLRTELGEIRSLTSFYQGLEVGRKSA